MSFVSPSARTVTVNNSDNNDNYSNSDSTATTSGAEANNDNTITNGSASPAGRVWSFAWQAVIIGGGQGVRPRLPQRPGCRCWAAAAFGGESLRGRGPPHPTPPAAARPPPMSPRRCPRSLRIWLSLKLYCRVGHTSNLESSPPRAFQVCTPGKTCHSHGPLTS